VVEKLIAKIFFQVDVARQQGGCEFLGKLGLAMKSQEHGFLLNAKDNGRFDCRRRADSGRLADKASLTEEVSRSEHRQYSFLALVRDNGELHFARLDKEDRVCGIPLGKGCLVFLKLQHLLACRNALEQAFDMRIDSYHMQLQGLGSIDGSSSRLWVARRGIAMACCFLRRARQSNSSRQIRPDRS